MTYFYPSIWCVTPCCQCCHVIKESGRGEREEQGHSLLTPVVTTKTERPFGSSIHSPLFNLVWLGTRNTVLTRVGM